MELSTYITILHDQFRRAEDSSANAARLSFSVAGKFVVEARFTDSRILPRFRSAIAHLLCDQTAPPDLTIGIWGGAPAQFLPYSRWGAPYRNHVADNNFVLDCRPEHGRLMALDCSTNAGLLWMRDFNQFPWFEDAQPFMDILHWWLRRKQLFFVHAAAVGTADGAALLVGKAGAGKSTTAISCLAGGLYYGSDDFCLIGRDDDPCVFSVYNSAKLYTLEAFSDFKQSAMERTRVDGDKEILFFHPQFEHQLAAKMPLSAILIPQITDQARTKISPSTHHAAIKALLPSTLECLKGCDVTEFYGIFKVTKTLPVYILELGSDRLQLVSVITQLLRSLANKTQHMPAAEHEKRASLSVACEI